MKIEITDIVVVSTGGTDNILINTTLPNGVWPYTGVATVKLQVCKGCGEDYVKSNFPNVPYKVVKG